MTTETKTPENAQNTQVSAIEVIAMLLKQNTDLRKDMDELIAKVNSNGGGTQNSNGGAKKMDRTAQPMVDLVTGKFYHTKSAAGIAVARAEGLKDLWTKSGTINTWVFNQVPDKENRFIPYVGVPLTKESNGKVVQAPQGKSEAVVAPVAPPVIATPVNTAPVSAPPAVVAQVNTAPVSTTKPDQHQGKAK